MPTLDNIVYTLQHESRLYLKDKTKKCYKTPVNIFNDLISQNLKSLKLTFSYLWITPENLQNLSSSLSKAENLEKVHFQFMNCHTKTEPNDFAFLGKALADLSKLAEFNLELSDPLPAKGGFGDMCRHLQTQNHLLVFEISFVCSAISPDISLLSSFLATQGQLQRLVMKYNYLTEV